MADAAAFPQGFFDRQDESDDAGFYLMPRLVAHIDPDTIAALTNAYRTLLPSGGEVLDLMSSWISHLPDDISYQRVAGLGMNAQELERNPHLSEFVVHDLNSAPELPYPDASFDAVINAVSIQYLTRPVEVFNSVARVLRPGGLHLIAMSHRCFPTKAIRAFHYLDGDGRADVVRRYFEQAGGYEPAERLDRTPAAADPLWIVMAKRLSS